MPDERFHTTRWSLILHGWAQGTPEARESFSELIRIYFYPCYAFVRSKVRDADRAWDLTQGFFADLMEKNRLATVVPGRGRFRNWLRTSLSNYMSNARDRERRVVGQPALPIDAAEVERRFGQGPSGNLNPDALMERAWALTTLERAIAALEAEDDELSRAVLEKLRGDGVKRTYPQIADALDRKPAGVKQSAHLLMKHWRDLLRKIVAETLDPDDPDDPNDPNDPGGIDREIRYLLSLLD